MRIGFVLFVICIGWTAASAYAQTPDVTIYDPQPNHLWNRIHSAIFIRSDQAGKQYGPDILDPMLWPDSSYLLKQPLNNKLIELLDTFLAEHGENSVTDPLKRAVLQHDLWAVFDWTMLDKNPSPEKQAVQSRLGKIIQRLALSKEEIAALPDNYGGAVAAKIFAAGFDPNQSELPFLPPDLLKKDGSWMAFGTELDAAGPIYTQAAGARNAFTLLVRLPNGRADSKSYIQRLNSNPTPYIRTSGTNPDGSAKVTIILNPNLPQFPNGTQFAAVRHMLLIDRNGTLRTSPIVDEVKLRVHHGNVSFFEFQIQRDKLFNKQADGLRAVGLDEVEFPHTLEINSTDPLESLNAQPRNTLKSCATCHVGTNLTTFLSYNRPYTFITPRPPTLSDRSEWDAMGRWTSIFAKYAREDWVGLKKLWVADDAK